MFPPPTSALERYLCVDEGGTKVKAFHPRRDLTFHIRKVGASLPKHMCVVYNRGERSSGPLLPSHTAGCTPTSELLMVH